MKTVLKRIAIFAAGTIALLAMAEPAFSKTSRLTVAELEEQWQRANAALQRNDLSRAERVLYALVRVAPDHPAFLLKLARAEARLGHHQAAIATLEHLINIGFGTEIATDESFSSLRSNPKFRDLSRKATALGHPIILASPAFDINEPDLIPEGMAYDPATQTFFISSMYKRKIVEVTASGEKQDFIKEGQDGIWKVFGMKVDAKRRELLVCSAAEDSQMKQFNPREFGRSGVFIFDLRDGHLLRKFVLETGKHLLNDLAETAAGDIYVTDSAEGSVYEIDAADGHFHRITESDRFLYPNGIALSPDDKLLYIAEIPGLQVIDLTTHATFTMQRPKSVSVVGIDGLYAYQQHLIAVQNGVEPQRVIMIDLNAKGTRIIGSRVLERNDPALSSPTTGAIAGKSLYFIANSQMNSFDAQDHIFPLGKLQPVHILKLDLSKALTGNRAKFGGLLDLRDRRRTSVTAWTGRRRPTSAIGVTLKRHAVGTEDTARYEEE